jgi:hypothetical protein
MNLKVPYRKVSHAWSLLNPGLCWAARLSTHFSMTPQVTEGSRAFRQFGRSRGAFRGAEFQGGDCDQ